jgi:PhzF family phenazine biosynthesis protein
MADSIPSRSSHGRAGAYSPGARASGEGLPAVLIEAFSDRPGAGNGAAVVLLEGPNLPGLSGDGWMRLIAGSLRQSETAFLVPHAEEWLLRWFTPRREVPLCGHATLASLLALRHWQRLEAGACTRFHTRSGPLEVRLDAERESMGHLQLPSGGLQEALPPASLRTLLVSKLGCGVERFWRSGLGYCVALLPQTAPLASLEPIAALLEGDLRLGLVLMQSLGSMGDGTESPRVGGVSADYQLRFFAPGLGIEEDPVTGSAHALVAPYWMERLGRSSVVGWQCSDRPGGMGCEAGSSGMIRVSGTGSLLWDGTLKARPQLCVEGSHSGGDRPTDGPDAWWALAPKPSWRDSAATPS